MGGISHYCCCCAVLACLSTAGRRTTAIVYYRGGMHSKIVLHGALLVGKAQLHNEKATVFSECLTDSHSDTVFSDSHRRRRMGQAAVTAELLYVPCLASPVALYETLQQGKAAFVLLLPRVGGASTTYFFSSPSRTRLDTALLQPARWILLNEV